MSKSKDKQFREDFHYRRYRLLHFAKKHNWKLVKDTGLEFVFKKFIVVNGHDVTMVIEYAKLEIKTSLFHPLWGYTTLTRKGEFTQKLIEEIFIYPREHMPNRIKSVYHPS